MPDANELVKIIKKAALDAMESSKPVNVYFGEVQGTNPLKINVEQKMLLGAKQLILTRNVTDFQTQVTVEWETETELGSHSHSVDLDTSTGDSVSGSTGSRNLAHTHNITGKKKITVHNGLVVGDEVILIRQQSGQKFIVVDRIGKK